jgi:hypothetical protein
MQRKSDTFDAIIGTIVVGCLVTGLAGLLGALFAFFSGGWLGAGVCLVAAALALGLAANAVLRE